MRRAGEKGRRMEAHMFERASRCDQDNSVSVIVAQTERRHEGERGGAEEDADSPSSAIPASMSANNEEAPGGRTRAPILIASPGIIRTREMRIRRYPFGRRHAESHRRFGHSIPISRARRNFG